MVKPAVMGLAVGGLLVATSAAWALTSLKFVTPQNLQEDKFQLTSKAAQNDTVEFVIRRDIRNISLPGRKGYLTNPKLDGKSLGTPVKLEEEAGKTLTFRFSVPEKRIADSVFMLWGNGLAGEGVTFHFKLRDFWMPKKD